jgi:hypothetical protein
MTPIMKVISLASVLSRISSTGGLLSKRKSLALRYLFVLSRKCPEEKKGSGTCLERLADSGR